MKKQVIILLLAITVTAAGALSGCGTAENSDGKAPAQTSENQKNTADENTLTVMGRVKNITDDTITLTVSNPGGSGGPAGSMEKPPSLSENGADHPPAISGNDAGQPPAMPDNDTNQPPASSGNDADQPPAMPDNDTGQPPASSGNGASQPPAASGNGAGQPPAMPDSSMTAGHGGEDRDITVTEDTAYTSERNQKSKKISLSDLSQGDMIAVVLDEDQETAVSIAVQPDQPGQGNGGSEAAGSADISLTGAKTIDGEKATSSDESFSSAADDENTILVENYGKLQLAGASLSKSGDTSSEDYSNFYGQNAVLAVTSGSSAELTNVVITSSGEGSNAIFATGKNASVLVDTAKIQTKGNSARGLDATYGGTITASNVDISTEGAHCAALATDRGEGTIDVTSASLSTQGEGSPCIYSTGKITVRDSSGTASGAQTLVVEGKNSVDLTSCKLKGSGDNGLMLYQSTSGDAQTGTAVLSATDSRLTTTSKGPMIYVTNTDAQITLTNTRLKFPGATLITAAGNETNNWGIPGQNGGNLTLTGIQQKLNGNVSCDAISTVSLTLSEDSVFTGAIDPEHTGKTTSIQLDDSSTWNVTEDSFISFLGNTRKDCSNINSNGCTIYYDSSHPDSKWLNKESIPLPGDGQLVPL